MSGKRSLKRGAVVTQKPGEGGVFPQVSVKGYRGVEKEGA